MSDNMFGTARGKPSRSVPFTLTALFFLLWATSFIIRVLNLGPPPLQSDEPLWVERAHGIITAIETDPVNATTHLPHPGLVPSALMALAQVIRPHVAPDPDLLMGSFAPWDDITVSRLALALLTSFAPLLAVLLFRRQLGWTGAWTVGLLVALDPTVIALSRIAHLDATLLMIVLCTVAFYWRGLTRDPRWILLAGVFWGLGLLTKPTVVVLIPAFLAFRFLLFRRGVVSTLLSWYEAAAVLIGHLVVLCLYTRMWHHPSRYLTGLKVRSRVADSIFNAGIAFGSHQLLATLFVLAVAATALIIGRSTYRTSGWAWFTWLTTLLGFTAFSFRPHILDNFIRYWMWVAGLSEEVHHSFQGITRPLPGGYLTLLAAFLPLIPVLIFFISSIPALFTAIECFESRRPHPSPSEKRRLMLLFAVVIVAAWLAFLNVSGKQSWRYAVPMVPFVYFSAVLFLQNAVAYLNVSVRARAALNAVALSTLILSQVITWARTAPQYELYSNTGPAFTRVLVESGHFRPRNGINRVLRFLNAEALQRQQKLFVSLVGDKESIQFQARRILGENMKLQFASFRPENAHFVLDTLAVDRFEGNWEFLNSQAPEMEFDFKGIPSLRLWRVPPSTFENEMVLDDTDIRGPSGTTIKIPVGGKSAKVVAAVPDVQKPGFVVATLPISFAPGAYTFTITMSSPRAENPDARDSAHPAEDGVVGDFLFSSRCSRRVRLSEIAGDDARPQDILVTCAFSHPTFRALVFNWRGKLPLHIHRVSVRRGAADVRAVSGDVPSDANS